MQRMAIEELDVFFDQQLFCGFVRRERQHGLLFFHPTIVRAAVDSLMYPLIGYFVEPTPAFTVCCLNIRCNPGGSESGHQRDVEALTGILMAEIGRGLATLFPDRMYKAYCTPHQQ